MPQVLCNTLLSGRVFFSYIQQMQRQSDALKAQCVTKVWLKCDAAQCFHTYSKFMLQCEPVIPIIQFNTRNHDSSSSEIFSMAENTWNISVLCIITGLNTIFSIMCLNVAERQHFNCWAMDQMANVKCTGPKLVCEKFLRNSSVLVVWSIGEFNLKRISHENRSL